MVRPTYIENWPAELHDLSIRSKGIRLTTEDARALGSNIIDFGELFGQRKPIDDLVERINGFIWKYFKDGAFVKLGSRSPKDRLYTVWGEGSSVRVTDGKEAVRLLCAGSERISDDLLLAINENYEPYIWLREWKEIPPWAEFRCFVRNRELIGISQYNYLKGRYFQEIEEYKEGIEKSIRVFYKDALEPILRLDSVIFDVFLAEEMSRLVTYLIELNPFFTLTDPCLFNWSDESLDSLFSNANGDFDGGFRYNKNTVVQRS
jgi:hypothetical protein